MRSPTRLFWSSIGRRVGRGLILAGIVIVLFATLVAAYR
jgi:hypothetical protein